MANEQQLNNGVLMYPAGLQRQLSVSSIRPRIPGCRAFQHTDLQGISFHRTQRELGSGPRFLMFNGSNYERA